MADDLAMPPKVACREIGPGTIQAAELLLNEGFPERSAAFWSRTLFRLAARRTPFGYPRFGYMLMCGDTPVGCILTIFSDGAGAANAPIRCNLAAFYTRPAYRPYATLLTLRALRHRDVTYLNVSPRANTFALLQAQGYQRYCEGTLLIAPALLPPKPDTNISAFDAKADGTSGLSEAERQLLLDHAELGCLSLVCRGPEGASPFVFQRRRVLKRLLPASQLLYCRSVEDFVARAGNLGRYLALRGAPLVLVDTDGPMPALSGRLLNLPKYYKGPVRPRLGDLSYTELPILGI